MSVAGIRRQHHAVVVPSSVTWGRALHFCRSCFGADCGLDCRGRAALTDGLQIETLSILSGPCKMRFLGRVAWIADCTQQRLALFCID